MLNILLGRCKLKQEGDTPTPVRRAKIPNADLSHLVLVTRWSNRNSHCLLLGMRNSAATWEHPLMVSYKILHFPCPPGAVLCGVYSNELKTYIHIETHTHMFISIWLIIAPNGKQPRYPSTGEWINCGTARTIECYSETQRNELSSQEKTWRNPQCRWLRLGS